MCIFTSFVSASSITHVYIYLVCFYLVHHTRVYLPLVFLPSAIVTEASLADAALVRFLARVPVHVSLERLVHHTRVPTYTSKMLQH